MRRTGSTIALMAVFVGALLAGCGDDDAGTSASTTGEQRTITDPDGSIGAGEGGGSGGARSDEDLIAAAIRGFLVSGAPNVVCAGVVTPAYVRSAYGDEAGCRAAAGQPGAAADSVRIDSTRIEGTTATAVAVPQGGPSDGVRLDVSLIREGPAWLIDAIDADVPPGP